MKTLDSILDSSDGPEEILTRQTTCYRSDRAYPFRCNVMNQEDVSLKFEAYIIQRLLFNN